MPSFDILSEPDTHEVKNAFDQAEREIAQRFDFRGCDAIIKSTKEGFELLANSEDKVRAILDVLKDKFVKRKISLKYLDHKDILKAGGNIFKLVVELKKGIDKEHAKSITALIKLEKNLKVSPAIQGEVIRVTAKKKDELQEAIAFLKSKELDIELSFSNYRD